MGNAGNRGMPAKYTPSPGNRIISLFVVLLLVLVAAPAVSASAGYAGTSGSPAAGPSPDTLEPAGVTAVPRAAVTLQPAPQPVRENRTSLIQIAKKAAERPKVSVPSGVFFLITAIAIIGLLAILYLLVRRTTGSLRGKEKPEKPAPEEKSTGRPPGPAVPFPPPWKNGLSTRSLSAKAGLPGSSGHRISGRA